RRLALDDAAELHELGQVLAGQSHRIPDEPGARGDPARLGDEHPASALDGDQARGFESTQGLAKNRAADSELGDQLVLPGEAISGFQVTLRDELLDLIDDVVDERSSPADRFEDHGYSLSSRHTTYDVISKFQVSIILLQPIGYKLDECVS